MECLFQHLDSHGHAKLLSFCFSELKHRNPDALIEVLENTVLLLYRLLFRLLISCLLSAYGTRLCDSACKVPFTGLPRPLLGLGRCRMSVFYNAGGLTFCEDLFRLVVEIRPSGLCNILCTVFRIAGDATSRDAALRNG